MSFKAGRLAFALGAAMACAFASAAPVSIDGVIGAEWAGVSVATVAHDPSAPTSNFGAPGPTTQGASYSVRVRGDGSYIYVALQITGDAASSAGNFANLYFDSNPPAADGSDIGLEVTNGVYFIPGVPGSYDASAYLTYDSTSHPGTIELAIANSFFTSGLKGSPVATGDVVLRLSQSFGYSVAGGATYGSTRLGSASVLPATSIPEPTSLALTGIALSALAGWRRRRA
jgi:hypothetical protein